uniref:Uncharacterized protein n=1 Tax=Solanum lycopersicum TaxID=4081 RepID=A0A3Q7FH84_SOLLC
MLQTSDSKPPRPESSKFGRVFLPFRLVRNHFDNYLDRFVPIASIRRVGLNSELTISIPCILTGIYLDMLVLGSMPLEFVMRRQPLRRTNNRSKPAAPISPNSDRKSSPYKGYPRAPQNSYPVFYIKLGYKISPPSYQIPAPIYQNLPPHYENTHPYYQAPSVNCSNIQPSNQNPTHATKVPFLDTKLRLIQIFKHNHPNPLNYHQVPSHCPRTNHEKKPSRVFTPLVEIQTQLFEILKSTVLIHTIDPKISMSAPSFIDPIFTMLNILEKVVTVQTATPKVNSNLMANHRGVTINVIEVKEDLYVLKLIISSNLKNLEKVVASQTKRENSKGGSKQAEDRSRFSKITVSLISVFFNEKGSRGGIKNVFQEGDIVLE